MTREYVFQIVALFYFATCGLSMIVSFILIPVIKLFYSKNDDIANKKVLEIKTFIEYVAILFFSGVLIYTILPKVIH